MTQPRQSRAGRINGVPRKFQAKAYLSEAERKRVLAAAESESMDVSTWMRCTVIKVLDGKLIPHTGIPGSVKRG